MIMETTVNTDLVIFDLDGTLLDTIGDLAVACNAVLGVGDCRNTPMKNTVISSATASCGSWNAPCPSRCARPKPSPRCAPTS